MVVGRQTLYQQDAQIRALRAAAEKLMVLADDNPAVVCNTRRILASVKMLELNVADALPMVEDD